MTKNATSINTNKIARTLRYRDIGYLVLAIGIAFTFGSLRSPDLSSFRSAAFIIVLVGCLIEVSLTFFKCPFCGQRFFSNNLFLSIGNSRCGHCKAGSDGIDP